MRTAAATLVFAAVAGCMGIFTGWMGHGLTLEGTWVSLIAGFIAAIAAWKTTPRPEPMPFTTAERVLLVVFALFAMRTFFWVVFTDHNAIKVLSPNNLGDMSLHLTFIHYFANGAPIWPANPIYASAGLAYPVGVDFLNSMLCIAGVDAFRGIVWVGLIGSALTAFTLRRWGRAFTMAGFLANGGLAGFALVAELLHGTLKLEDFQADLAWKSIPLALFTTQRSLLYAIPSGLLLLISWRARFFSTETESAKWKLPPWIEWLLYSTMPLFHVHTFLALSFMLGAWLLFPPNARRWQLAKLIAASLIPGTILVALVTNGFASNSMIHWKPGWMQDDDGFLPFWIRNFGLLPFFVIALIVHILYQRNLRRIAFVLPATLLFLICCFVAFAAWEWDNTKLMIWAYLIVLPFLWETMIAVQPLWLRAAICVVFFFSGFASLIGGIDASQEGYDIAACDELDSLAMPLAQIPIQATFAAFPTYNHPLLLMGRKVVEGYQGHLASYGIEYGDTEAKLTALMNGDSEWQDLARDLGVQYLFWGPLEAQGYPNSKQPWVNHAELVAAARDWRIFRLRAAK